MAGIWDNLVKLNQAGVIEPPRQPLQINPFATTSGLGGILGGGKMDHNYNIRAFHGTRSPEPIEKFETGNIYNDRGDLVHQGSNDPNAYIGPHFADSPQIANKFAAGKGAAGLRSDWLQSRFTEGEERPRVYPVMLHGGNVKKFKSEDELNDFVHGHNVNTPEIERILEDEHDGDLEAGGNKYASDAEYRTDVNRRAVKNESQYDEPSTETAGALGSAARASLEKEGVTTVQYPNAVEGGNSYIAIEPPRSLYTGASMGYGGILGNVSP